MAGGAWGMIAEAAADVGTSVYALDQARREARTNRDFQREMSNSAYTRAMADMKRAGLNPMLAAKTGGASTPSGATANLPDVSMMGGKIANSAIAIKNAQEDVRSKKLANTSTAKEVKLLDDAWKYYADNPDKQQALHEAKLAQLAGIRPELGALSGLFRQGNEAGQQLGANLMTLGGSTAKKVQELWNGIANKMEQQYLLNKPMKINGKPITPKKYKKRKD